MLTCYRVESYGEKSLVNITFNLKIIIFHRLYILNILLLLSRPSVYFNLFIPEVLIRMKVEGFVSVRP